MRMLELSFLLIWRILEILESFIVEREKNDDDLPDFNELEGPPDESEDEEIEAEVED